MPGKISPPSFYVRLFRWLCKEQLFDELQGDLEEEFYYNVEQLGKRKASVIYKQEVLKMIRPSVLKRLKLIDNSIFYDMFKINTKLALRNLLKNKLYTAINIGGLAVSIAVCGILLLYVNSETNFDNYHPDYERTYRLALDRIYPDHTSHYAITPYSMAEQATRDFPEIEDFTRIFPAGFGTNVTYNNETFLENDIIAGEANFLDFFGIKLLQGNRQNIFNTANSVLISERMALKYFGTESPIGKILQTDIGDLEVSGVVENTPKNTHFKFDFLVNLEGLPFFQQPNYVNFSVYNYLKLSEGVAPATVNQKMKEVVEKYAAGQIEREQRISFEDYTASGNGYRYFLQPIEDIHLKSHLEGEFEPNGNITYIYIFFSIAVFIVILAAINFINLATARSTERAKEVGIRKVLGSEKKQLVSQFIIESVVVSIVSMLIGILLIYLALPPFNTYLDKEISLLTFASPLNIGLALVASFGLGILAGTYPAFVLSSFKPVVVLKGKLIKSQQGYWIRNGLVVFQFFVSIVLICSTLIVGQQMQYLQKRNLGFDRENVLVLSRAFGIPDLTTFKNELEAIPGVSKVGLTSAMPGTGFYYGASFRPAGTNESIALNCAVFDEDYIETMGIKLAKGRGFSKDFQDTLALILNESATRALGIEHSPIGQRIVNVQGANNPQGDITYEVVGVISDYNYKSLHTEITPMAIFSRESSQGGNIGAIALKTSTNQGATIVAQVEKLWQEIAPNQTFVYSFLDTDLSALYEAEQRSGDMFMVFTGIAIWIACIGLFGLATFMIGNRIKEIGVRKVLGASSQVVVWLLLKDFNKLIAISLLLAIPASVWVMGQWLGSFAYRIEMLDTWVSFVIGGTLALVVAWLTVSYHSIRAAVANPVKNLRTE
ncbi:ABC transporter permease [Roseivirga sp. UBA1976]|uniref:ABC transporter permease n=1 Tax=Roseivirga sp. UBA1976 TaxID=1947386 RepID=UPI00258083D6|nr:ABC transporter permease [Roseivirga sp. UBA1976]MEC7753580.1 ABC transporter permease [Bacteroidota bacterium]|tara:strand:+ start:11619 stop:14285 length:2667 start_codon:yes stop_codon:yes gene_type:complete